MKSTFTIYAVLFNAFLIFSQSPSLTRTDKEFFFNCRGDSVYINLPLEYIGPKYDSGEEGPIVYFIASDLSIVAVLCAGNTILQLDSNYLEIDSTKINEKAYSVLYYSEIKNRYARKLRTNKRFYLYSDATLKRKQELDISFRQIEELENK